MKKIKNTVLAAVCCTGLMVLGCVGLAQAQDVTESTGTRQQREVGPGVKPVEDLEVVSNQIRIWGPVLGVEEGVNWKNTIQAVSMIRTGLLPTCI